jgi:hypothetical protein
MDLRKKLAKAFADFEVANRQKVTRVEVNTPMFRRLEKEMWDVFFPNYVLDSFDPDGRLWGANVYVNDALLDNQVVLESR